MSDAAVSLPESTPRVVALRFAGDDRLARLASRGSQQAFAEIYKRYHQPLYRYCLSIVRNPEDAGDALQSAMAKALQALPGEERQIALKPWLYRIAHNESISLLRRRRDHEPIDDAERVASGTAESDVAMREQLRELVTDLGELSERQRGALIMRELNGLEYDDIAEAFSISPAAAKQTVYEARTALHERAEGREMDCATIRQALSDGDRRVARGRRIRSHVNACAGCRDFEALLRERPAQLAALAPPLPAAAAAAILKGLLGGGGGSAGGGFLATLGGGAATQTKFVAIGAATVVAGAGVIGVVGGVVGGAEAEEPRGSAPVEVARDDASKDRARHDRRRGTQGSDRGSRRGGDRAGRGDGDGLARARQRQGTLTPNQGDGGERLPPAGEYVVPGPPRVTSGAPPVVDNTGRRVTRLGDTVENLVGDLPVAVPDEANPALPDVGLPR